MRKKIASLLLLVSLIILAAPASATYQPELTGSYLKSSSQNAWTVLGQASLKQTQPDLSFLQNINSSSAIDFEAPALALHSYNQNFSSHIEKIKSFFDGQQIGDASTVNDDIFGILALLASGQTVSSSEISSAKNFIIKQQKNSGGWGWSISADPDSDTTAAAVVALAATGSKTSDEPIANALKFLKSNQNPDGGIAPDKTQSWGQDSSVSTTAWTIWALNALKISPSVWQINSSDPKIFLEKNQQANGSFDASNTSFSPTVAAYAAIALSGKTLPLVAENSTQNRAKKINFRIEGSAGTVCQGTVWAQTALQAVENSSNQCGFTYHIKNTSFGPYLETVNSDTAAGEKGWLYTVNYTSPQVGAADYLLKENDSLLWYFEKFDAQLTRISLDSPAIEENSKPIAKIEFLNNSSWQPLEGAEIFFGSISAITNAQGEAETSLPPGYFMVYGKKNGFVRSNSLYLKVGEPSNNEVSLSANIAGTLGEQTPPQEQNDIISFQAEPGFLNFGSLTPGQNKSLGLQLKNNGSVDIQVKAQVSGDNIFQNNLKLNGQSWQNYAKNLTSGVSDNLSAGLEIPANFQPEGLKQGKLIFWASPQ